MSADRFRFWRRQSALQRPKPEVLPRLIAEPITTWIWTTDGGYEVTVTPEQANAMLRADDAQWDRAQACVRQGRAGGGRDSGETP